MKIAIGNDHAAVELKDVYKRQHITLRVQKLSSVEYKLISRDGETEHRFSFKKCHAVFVLEPPDMTAQCLLADVKTFSSPCLLYTFRCV